MAPSTVLDCFDEEHPTYECENKKEMQQANVTPSSTTTKTQLPPRTFVRVDADRWQDVAVRVLTSPEVVNNDTLKTHAATKKFLGLVTEADVVRVAEAHLIDPVMQVLDVVYPGMLTSSSEDTVGALRVDLAIKLKTQGKNQAVVLMEYKRCGYLDYDELEDAMCERDQVEQTLLGLRRERRRTMLDPDSNALVFVKQATAYHMKTGCKYVALCDYDGLVLLGYRGGKDLESVDVTTVPRPVFRKALLGFMLEACSDVDMS